MQFDAIAEDCEVGIYETSKLIKMLSVMSDEVGLSLNKKDDKITSVNISDTTTVAQFITDLSVIPTAESQEAPRFHG